MAAKTGELKVRWSKKERDILYEYGGGGVQKSDASWLYSWLCYHKGFDAEFVKELEARGFDITTLKISVQRKL